MTGAFRIIGIIVCLALIIASAVAIAPAAIGLVQTPKGQGTQFGMAFADQPSAPASDEEINQAIKVLTERLKKLGVKDAIVERSQKADEHIQVLLPPGTDVGHIAPVLNADGLLELKFVAKQTPLPYPTKGEAEAAAKSLVGYEVLRYRPRDSNVNYSNSWVIVEKTPVITSQDMLEVKASPSQFGDSNYEIDFKLKPEAADRFARETRNNIGNFLAIVLNGEVRSAPIVNSEIHDRGQITGGFTKQSAEDLAIVLGSGALPRRLVYVREEPVDGSRWTGPYKKRAGFLGVAIVALFGLLYLLLRSRPAREAVYRPATYGHSSQ